MEKVRIDFNPDEGTDKLRRALAKELESKLNGGKIGMIHKIKGTENGFNVYQGSPKEIERLFLERACKHIICNSRTYNYLVNQGLFKKGNITWTCRKMPPFDIYINRFS